MGRLAHATPGCDAPRKASAASSTTVAAFTPSLDSLADRSASRRQSKLSGEQLAELQKSTHFDKKELQQWYKGERLALPFPSCPRGPGAPRLPSSPVARRPSRPLRFAAEAPQARSR